MDSFSNKTKKSIKTFLWIIKQSSLKLTFVNLVIASIQAFIPLGILYLVKQIIDAIIHLNPAHNSISDLRDIYLYIGCIAFAFLINQVLLIISDYIKDIQSHRISSHINNLIYQKTASLNLEFFESAKYQNTYYKVIQESSSRIYSMLNSAILIFQNLLTLIAIFSLIISIQWIVACFMIVVGLPIVYFRSKFQKELYLFDSENVEAEREINYYHRVLTGEVFAKEVRLFQLSSFFSNRLNDKREIHKSKKFKITRKIAIQEILLFILIAIIMFLAYASIVYSASIGIITTGALVLYFFALQRGFGLIKSISSAISSFLDNTLFLSYLDEFNAIKTETTFNKTQQLPAEFQIGLKLENVSYSYPNKDQKVLRNINLQIKPGETIAIVGENGAGKTTLVKLLCKLYNVQEGKISIESIDYNNLDASVLQKRIAVLFQDYVLFNTSARENIWYGNLESDLHGTGVYESATKADIHEKITSLPNNYDRILGKLFKDSSEFSIGQSQKLALARAFFKNADILILDEPSSSLDAKAENEIFAKFRELSKEKTTIYISHRFSTVKQADRIYVMHNGEIIESGAHDELLSQNGKYSYLYKLQADNFQD